VSDFLRRVAEALADQRAISENRVAWRFEHLRTAEQERITNEAKAALRVLYELPEDLLEEGVQGEILSKYALQASVRAIVEVLVGDMPPTTDHA
jgi:hypothetical protein